MRGELYAIFLPFLVNLSPIICKADHRPCPSDWIDQVIAQTNSFRNARGLSSLEYQAELTRAATARVHVLLVSRELTHDSWLDSVSHLLSPGHVLAENIAYGHIDGRAVSELWYESRGHQKNILNEAFRYIGVSCALDQEGASWWVQLFKS